MGNLLYSDDGLGVAAVQRLQQGYRFPEEVELVDGGTLGLELLRYFEGLDELWIVDAVHAGAEPGTLVRLEGDEIPLAFTQKLSLHQAAVVDLLTAARWLGIAPSKVVLIGIEPEKTDFGLGLTPAVASQLDVLIGLVAAGFRAQPVSDFTSEVPVSVGLSARGSQP